MKVYKYLIIAISIISIFLCYKDVEKLFSASKSARSSWNNRGYSGNGDYIDSTREMVEDIFQSGDDIIMIPEKEGVLTSIERSTHLAVSWTISPQRVRLGGLQDVWGADIILAAKYNFNNGNDTLEIEGDIYKKIGCSKEMSLWSKRETDVLSNKEYLRSDPLLEFLGVLSFIFVLIIGWYINKWCGALANVYLYSLLMLTFPLMSVKLNPIIVSFVILISSCFVVLLRNKKYISDSLDITNKRENFLVIILGLIFLIALCIQGLSHTYMTPNGLGVSGGRAKLFYLAERIPDWFFTDKARSTLQPAYPLGLAMIVLGCYGMATVCGEWLTQLVGILPQVLLFIFLLSRTKKLETKLFVVCLFFNSLGIRMGTLMYSEPFVALYILVGWERVRKNTSDVIGWCLIGASCWFKNEGLIYFIALWIATHFRFGMWFKIKPLIFSVAIPMIWFIGVRLVGGGLEDYSKLSEFSFDQSYKAFLVTMRYAFVEAWDYGFVFPMFLLLCLNRKMWDKRLLELMLFTLLSFTFISCVFGCSRAYDLIWHMRSIERLIWVPSLLLAREIIDRYESILYQAKTN